MIPGLVPNNTVANSVVRVSVSGSALSRTPQELTGSSVYTQFPQNVAPAFSLDGSIMYLVVTSSGTSPSRSALIGVEPATLTLTTRADNSPMIIELFDPESGSGFAAIVSDVSTSSPVVGPDGDVYFGVRGNPNRQSIGWMLHFNSDLSVRKTHGSHGWDITPSIVPISMINSALYQTNATYLVLIKANHYIGRDCEFVLCV